MHELVIRGGTVVDGTGAPARTADVAVDGGRITEVGTVDGRGPRELDADGLVVAPGWVDIHTHYDGQVTWDPELTPSSWHGVTTVVMGNCGVGFAPVRPGGEELPHRADGGRGGHPRHRAARGHRLGLGELPRVPRRARHDAARHRRRRPGAPRRAARLRDGRAGPRQRHRRRRDRRDVAARRGGAAGRRLRRQHEPDDPAQLQARPRARHRTRCPRSSSPSATPSAGPATACSSSSPTSRAAPATASGSSTSSSAPGSPPPTRWPRPATRRRRAATRSRPAPRTPASAAASSRRWPAGPPGCSSACSRRCTRSSPTRPTGRIADLPLAERVARLREPEVRAALLAEEPATKNPIARGPHAALGPDLPARRPARLRAAALGQRRRRGRARGPGPAGGRPRLAARAGRHGVPVRPARQLRRPRPRGDPRDDDRPDHRARPVRRRRPLRAHLRRQHADLPAHPLGERPHPRRAARARAGDQPADVAHRRRLRLHRPRRARARASGPTST